MVNELVSGVELIVMQRLSVDIKINVDLRESWQNGR
jgi:hypothetical protein